MHSRHIAWLRYSISILSTGVPSSGAARGEVGRQSTSSGPISSSMRALTSARRALASASMAGVTVAAHATRSLTPGPSFGRASPDPVADAGPHFGGLEGAEGLEPGDEALRRDLDLLALADQRLEARDGRLERARDRRFDERKGVAGDQQAPWFGCLLAILEEHAADLLEDCGIAREPAGHVEARSERHRAVERHAAPGRAHAEDAAVARRDAHRAAAVRAQREIDEPARHRRGRSVRRAAGNAPRRVDVDGGAVVHVLAGQAVAELVAVRAPDHVGARRQEALHGLRRALRRRVGGEPVGMAEARALALDVEQVLDREGQPGERALARPGERRVVVRGRRRPAGRWAGSSRRRYRLRSSLARISARKNGGDNSRLPPRGIDRISGAARRRRTRPYGLG